MTPEGTIDTKTRKSPEMTLRGSSYGYNKQIADLESALRRSKYTSAQVAQWQLESFRLGGFLEQSFEEDVLLAATHELLLLRHPELIRFPRLPPAVNKSFQRLVDGGSRFEEGGTGFSCILKDETVLSKVVSWPSLPTEPPSQGNRLHVCCPARTLHYHIALGTPLRRLSWKRSTGSSRPLACGRKAIREIRPIH